MGCNSRFEEDSFLHYASICHQEQKDPGTDWLGCAVHRAEKRNNDCLRKEHQESLSGEARAESLSEELGSGESRKENVRVRFLKMRYHSNTMKFTFLKGTVQEFLV